MHAKELFSELVSDMRCIGFNVDAFNTLRFVSFNRPVKMKEAASLARLNTQQCPSFFSTVEKGLKCLAGRIG